jgi:hypothetical protein
MGKKEKRIEKVEKIKGLQAVNLERFNAKYFWFFVDRIGSKN